MAKNLQLKDVPESEILQACRDFHAGRGPTPEKSLAHKYPPKLILKKMEKMADANLIEYGVSLRTAWVVGENKADNP